MLAAFTALIVSPLFLPVLAPQVIFFFFVWWWWWGMLITIQQLNASISVEEEKKAVSGHIELCIFFLLS